MDNKDLQTVTDEPDIDWLSQKYQQTIGDLGAWIDQQRDNYDIRYCKWAGQSPDGRKHGEDVLPWDGSSDLRTFEVDKIINENVSVMCSALDKVNLQAVPVESGDIRMSKQVGLFLKWLLFSQMKEYAREREILANYVEEKGMGVLGVYWETSYINTRENFTMDDLAEAIGDPQALIELMQQDEETIKNILMQIFPDMGKRKVNKMLKDLQEQGTTKITVKKLACNRPKIKAYTVDEDLFFPINTVDFQHAPFVFKSDYYTPEQLKAKAEQEEWDRNGSMK